MAARAIRECLEPGSPHWETITFDGFSSQGDEGRQGFFVSPLRGEEEGERRLCAAWRRRRSGGGAAWRRAAARRGGGGAAAAAADAALEGGDFWAPGVRRRSAAAV